MANEDKRKFSNQIIETNSNVPEEIKKEPKNQLEA